MKKQKNSSFATIVLAVFWASSVSGFWVGQELGYRRTPQINQYRCASPSTSALQLVPQRQLTLAAVQHPSPHLDTVEAAVDATLAAAEATLRQSTMVDGATAAIPVPKNPSSQSTATREASNVLGLPEAKREAYGAARVLRHKLDKMARGGDCRRCWLKPQHCVCASCQPLVLAVPTDTTSAAVACADTTLGTLITDECHPLDVPGPAFESCAVSVSAAAEGNSRESAAAGAVGASFPVRRLFVLMHHKEVGLAVDTAKLLLAAYPTVARLLVGGLGGHLEEEEEEEISAANNSSQANKHIKGDSDDDGNREATAKAIADMGPVPGSESQGRRLQPTYRELVQALAENNNRAFVLFPALDAKPFSEVAANAAATTSTAAKGVANTNEHTARGASVASDVSEHGNGSNEETSSWDVVVIDGTWEQARKMHARLLTHVAEARRFRQERTQRRENQGGGDDGNFSNEALSPSLSSSSMDKRDHVGTRPREAARVKHVCLSDAAVATLGAAVAAGGEPESKAGNGVEVEAEGASATDAAAAGTGASGLQLRRHPTRWRQVRPT